MVVGYVLLIVLVGWLFVAVALATSVYRHADGRDMNGDVWATVTLVGGPIVAVFYLLAATSDA